MSGTATGSVYGTPATHIWRPSVARLLVLDTFVPVPRGSVASLLPPLQWPAKDPADVLDYQFDITPATSGNAGDAISTLDVAIAPSAPGDLSLRSAAADGSRAVLWLGGGQAGTTYTVTLSIGTQAGRTLSRSVLLPVVALSAGVPVTNALLTQDGVPLLDENNNPLLVEG